MLRRPFLPVLAGLAFLLPGCGKKPAPPPPTPPTVRVQEVRAADLPVTLTYVGRSASNSKLAVVPRVTGVLLESPFTEGGVVKAGDILFRIDPSEYQAKLDEAVAKRAQMQAQLAQAESNLKRTEPLAAAGAASRQDLENARTQLLSMRANLAAAEAGVTAARLMLDFTTIRAPFTGIAGKAAFGKGAQLSPQSGTILVVDELDPIPVEFTVSEAELLGGRRETEAGRLSAVSREQFEVKATLLDGSQYPEIGRIDFRDVRINPQTGTALLRAKFPNPGGKIGPGQFIRVTLVGVTRKDAIAVPQSAVIQSANGASVFVLKADGTVESRPIVPAEWVGKSWRIESGLKSGDVVVTEGMQRLRAGMKVSVENAPAR